MAAKEQLINMCCNFIFETILNDNVSEDIKGDIVKRLFKIKPPMREISLTISFKGEKHTRIFNIKFKRSDYTGYKEWRTKVFQRDGYKCVKCSSIKQLHAHHIIGWAENYEKRIDLDNGETLCKECHKMTYNYGNKGIMILK